MRAKLEISWQLAIALFFLVVAGSIVQTAYAHYLASFPVHRQLSKDYRPDLSLCPDDVELWLCIKDALHAKRTRHDNN